MDYMDAINEGFELYDEIENEMRTLGKTHNRYTDANYSEGILVIESDWKTKNVEAKVEIKKEEIVQKVIGEEVNPKEAICKLLKQKVCLAAQDIKK